MDRPGAWWVIVGLGVGSASCGQILGIDKDYHPFDGGEGGATADASASSGGTGGAADAASSAGAGGTSASSSASTSTSTSSSASSSSSGTPCMPSKDDTSCGPDGNDVDCDGVVGNCLDTQLVYVGMKVTSTTDCVSKAIDFRMSTVMTDLPVDFPLVAQFRTFTQKPTGSNVIEISTCAGGTGKHVVSFGTSTCTSTSLEYKSLGYVSTKAGMGYEQLAQISYQGITAAVPASANAAGNQVCCHASCSAIPYYVLQ